MKNFTFVRESNLLLPNQFSWFATSRSFSVSNRLLTENTNLGFVCSFDELKSIVEAMKKCHYDGVHVGVKDGYLDFYFTQTIIKINSPQWAIRFVFDEESFTNLKNYLDAVLYVSI